MSRPSTYYNRQSYAPSSLPAPRASRALRESLAVVDVVSPLDACVLAANECVQTVSRPWRGRAVEARCTAMSLRGTHINRDSSRKCNGTQRLTAARERCHQTRARRERHGEAEEGPTRTTCEYPFIQGHCSCPVYPKRQTGLSFTSCKAS